MIEIRIKGEALDIPEGFAMNIEDSSPIFNDRGSQSLPATVPATNRNMRLLNAAHRVDSDCNPNNPEQVAEVTAGAYIRRGTLNLTSGSRRSGYTFNIGFDNSTAYAKWSKMRLKELKCLPVFYPELASGSDLDELLYELYQNYRSADPQSSDFAIFPLAVNNEEHGEEKYGNKPIYWDVLNLVGDRGFMQPDKVNRIINGEVTEVKIPQGYCVSPFLRVWRVLELVFEALNLEIINNPFRANIELARLVVLNNSADSVCLGHINYADLMPDSTVEEFLNALWVRFGLVYNVNYDKMTADLRLIRDIVTQPHATSLDNLAADYENLVYEEKQYVKLSAKTSIEGAAPSTERFEDFIKGLDVSKVHLGSDVSIWTQTGTPDKPKWDGDEYLNEWYDDEDYEEPEPDEPDWDNRDDDYYESEDYEPYSLASKPVTKAASTTDDSDDSSSAHMFLAREFITGYWYRLDATNGTVRKSSSGFFNWDPQPDGYTALELSSDDEFVPVGRVSTVGFGTGHSYNKMTPLYLFGARHYHSYIKGGDENGEDGNQTPLAFLFAYTIGNETIGRTNGEGGDGKPLMLDDGSKPTLSLLFQFKDGLFAKFWSEYDEILRHGNRSVELPVRIGKLDLHKLDLLNVYTLKNIRCLINTAAYSLPTGRNAAVDLKLRTIQPQGKYDIRKEQNIPDFSIAARHLEWKLKSDGYTVGLDTTEVRQLAIKQFEHDNNYEEHGTPGDFWSLGTDGAICRSSTRLEPTWQTDTLPVPNYRGGMRRTYQAQLNYDIYEIHDIGSGDDVVSELGDEPIGHSSVVVDYIVELVARWVSD